MLKIYDQDHIQTGILKKYTELKLECILESADKILSFHVKDPDEVLLRNEYYVRTRTDEFVIKKIGNKSWSGMNVTCALNLEELQGKPFVSFVVADKTIREAAEIALEGTGWSVGECDVVKIRSAGMIDCDALQVIKNLCTVWMCEHDFDTLHKKVNFYSKKGGRKGAYFMDGLNLKQLNKEMDSYDYYTIIIPYGKDGLTIENVNGGKNYLENYQYSKKKLAYIWKDESYTDPETLMEDAKQKLQEMSKPQESYSCNVIDLARQRKEYAVLSYDLGDEIKLINRETRTLTWQRITKMTLFQENPQKNTCELSNVTLTFTEMQEKLRRASEIINYVMTSDGRYTGKINVSDILNFESGISKTETVAAFNKGLSDLQDEVEEIKNGMAGMENLRGTFVEISKENLPAGWMTADKTDIQGISDAIFLNVIQGAEFVNPYMQNPRMTGADIEADSLMVGGKDVVQILDDLSGLTADAERISTLEEQVKSILTALQNVISDG